MNWGPWWHVFGILLTYIPILVVHKINYSRNCSLLCNRLTGMRWCGPAYTKMGLPQKMYVMFCGRFTPMQRNIIQKQFKFHSSLYLDILSYFITESGRPRFKDVPLPEDFPHQVFIADQPDQNNTDDSINLLYVYTLEHISSNRQTDVFIKKKLGKKGI